MSDYDLPKMPERDEMIAILDLTLAHGEDPANSPSKRLQALRDHTLYALALAAGLRSFELSALAVGVVFDSAGRARESIDLSVYKGSARRNGKTQRVRLADRTRATLESFWRLKHAAREPLSPDSPLFVSQKGLALSTRQMRRAFKEWQALAGVREDRSFHGIRHAAVTTVYEKSKHNIIAAQVFARHADIKTTARYAHARRDAVNDAVNQAADFWAPSVRGGSKR